MFDALDATILVFIGYCLGSRFDSIVALWPIWAKFTLGIALGLVGPLLFEAFHALRRFLR